MKRSASVSGECLLERDRAITVVSSHSLLSLPFNDYAAIYFDDEGKLNVLESASIQKHGSTLFTPEVRQKFLDSLRGTSEFTMFDGPTRRVRRRLAGVDSESDDCSENEFEQMLTLRVGDTRKVTGYYKAAIEAFLEYDCNVVLREFIKFIELNKHVRHPSNGSKASRGPDLGTKRDLKKTKPKWWPVHVAHKNPDNLGKGPRTELLLHIIRKLGSQGFTAKKLKEVLGSIKESLQPSSHLDIIYDILWVREVEEHFERGEYGPNMTMKVVGREPRRRRGEEEKSPGTTRTPNADKKIKEKGPIAPTSAVEQAVHTVVSSDNHDDTGDDEVTPIWVADTQRVINYYKRALNHFQQLNCRTVAKEFIKFIEPRKQVNHPYNGGVTRNPEKTKPDWWPEGVMHKEPDHLRKELRIELLIHIIRKLGDKGITAQKLKEVAGDTKRSLKNPSQVEIIYEILQVREMEELYERGGRDAIIYVKYCGQNSGDDGPDEPVVTPHPGDVNIDNVPIIPMSTNEQGITAIPAGLPCPIPGSFPVLHKEPECFPREAPDSTPFLFSSDQLHSNAVPYNPWEVSIFHQNAPVRYSTLGTNQGFLQLSAAMPILSTADQLSMGRHPPLPLHSCHSPAALKFEQID